MTRSERIPQVLRVLNPQHIFLDNESDQHSGPLGRETHFKLLVVSDDFEGLSRIDRQRKVNDLLKAEFESGLHALTQRLLTKAEFEKTKDTLVFVSPDCAHKNKS